MLLESDHLPGTLSFSQGKQIINLHNYLPNFVMHLELYWEGGVIGLSRAKCPYKPLWGVPIPGLIQLILYSQFFADDM